jgi:hypothetical protein
MYRTSERLERILTCLDLQITRDIPDEVSKLEQTEQKAEKRRIICVKRATATKICRTAVNLCSAVLAASSLSGVTASVLMVYSLDMAPLSKKYIVRICP